jgi:hypothetical protein
LSNDYFKPSTAFSIAADTRLPWRGLVAGLSVEWAPLKYEPDEDVSYSLFTLMPRVGYRYLGWKTSKGFLSALSPFVNIGAGTAYVAVSDERYGDAIRSGELCLAVACELGVDVGIGRGFAIRISGKPEMVFQSEDSLVSIGAGASAVWELWR